MLIETKKTVLYLLVFKTGSHFKFGFTNCDRVKIIHKAYLNDFGGVDENKSLIFSAIKDSVIIDLERQLKTDYGTFSIQNNGKTGYTEILPITYFSNVLNDIMTRAQKTWHQIARFNLSETNYLQKPLRSAPKSPVTKKVNPHDELYGAFILLHDIGILVVSGIFKEGKEIFHFCESEHPGAFSFCRWALTECSTTEGNGFYKYFLSTTYNVLKGEISIELSKRFINDVMSGRFIKILRDLDNANEIPSKLTVDFRKVDTDEDHYARIGRCSKDNVKISAHVYNYEWTQDEINARIMSLERICSNRS